MSADEWNTALVEFLSLVASRNYKALKHFAASHGFEVFESDGYRAETDIGDRFTQMEEISQWLLDRNPAKGEAE